MRMTALYARSINFFNVALTETEAQVVGEAQGSQSSLDKFVQNLNMGPSAAKVSKVDQNDISTKNDETKFNQ